MSFYHTNYIHRYSLHSKVNLHANLYSQYITSITIFIFDVKPSLARLLSKKISSKSVTIILKWPVASIQ